MNATPLTAPITRFRIHLFLLYSLLLMTGCQSAMQDYPWRTLDGEPPIIIAHRGDSGHYPEHTLAGYRSAMKKGADFIEADVVLTRDGVAVCRHDLYLSTSTDIASRPEFADRRRVFKNRNDWFVFDLTYDELKTLRAKQPCADRDPSHNGKYPIPTLSDLYTNYERWRDELGLSHGDCGLYIELKKPAEHLEVDPTLDVFSQVVIQDGSYRMSGEIPPKIFLQCFDRKTIEQLASHGRLPLPTIWLTSDPVDFDNLPKGIKGLGVNKDLIDIVDGQSAFIDAAHEKGLVVHVWTFRDDRINSTGYDTGQAEIEAYLRAGVDGVFTDFPATGIAARQAVQTSRPDDRTQYRFGDLTEACYLMWVMKTRGVK